MRLPAILKILFSILYVLWAAGLYFISPPEGVFETIGILAGAAVIFVVAYFFYLFLIRAVLRANSKRSGKGRTEKN